MTRPLFQWPIVTTPDPDEVEPPKVDSRTWVDMVAVERAADGHKMALSPAERVEVVRRLNARGLNDHEVAAVIGMAHETVARIRRRNQIPAIVVEPMPARFPSDRRHQRVRSHSEGGSTHGHPGTQASRSTD
jgi:D-aminopeptidase